MEINRKLSIIANLRWLSIGMGMLMFIFIYITLGLMIALLLGAAAALGFFIVVNTYFQQVIREIIKDLVDKAIIRETHLKCAIRSKTFNSGVLARIYLIGTAKDQLAVKETIKAGIEESAVKKHLRIIQIAFLKETEDIQSTDEELDKQLLNDMTGRRSK